MSRKFRSTEISGEVNVPHTQHTHKNVFCVNCHAIGSLEKHYPDCPKREAYSIVTSAEVPRKNASKRAWDIFKAQFVFVKPNGWWSKKENSWWCKVGKYQKKLSFSNERD